MIVAETKRLLIRRPLLNDLDALLDLYADPAAAKLLGAAPTADAVRRQLVDSAAAFEADGSGLLTVIDHHRGEVVGQCGVQRVELDGVRRDVLVCVIHRTVRRQGLGTEAATAIRDRADTGELCALVAPDNPAGAALAAGLGFTETSDAIVDGQAMTMHRLPQST